MQTEKLRKNGTGQKPARENLPVEGRKKKLDVRKMVVIALASALGYVLMLLEMPLPIAPAFIKLDFSEVPGLLLAFSYGPLAGVAVELFKNLLHLFNTHSMGVGELSNFILGCALVIPAGLIYKRHKTKKTAVLGTLAGTLCFAIFGIFSNMFLVFPFYTQVSGISMKTIIGMCQAVLPYVDCEWKVFLLSVTPFNLLKGSLVSIIILLIYKGVSPILKRPQG